MTRHTTGSGNAVVLGAANLLCFAAAPTFAVMALLTGVAGRADMLCSVAGDPSPFSGMIPMYLLMSAFHLTPWLRLISGLTRGFASSVGVADTAPGGIPPHLSLPPFDGGSQSV